MQTKFDELVDSYLLNKIGISQHFLDESLAQNMNVHLRSLHAENQLKQAQIGNDSQKNLNKEIRSDKIYWLDRIHDNAYENEFLHLIDLFIRHLNENCYTGITGCEFHFAIYEKGAFYKRHLDQFKRNKKRAFSMIFYLNQNWVEGDGGELCIYQLNQTQLIQPLNRTCTFFNSADIEHEVLLCHQQRMSITGWLTRD